MTRSGPLVPPPPCPAPPHPQVHMLQVLCLLLQLSTIFRVVALYHPEYSTNPNLFYPLQVPVACSGPGHRLRRCWHV